MSYFLIYASVITFIYVLYYVSIIYIDSRIANKKKEGSDEVISPDGDLPVAENDVQDVSEDGDGFSIKYENEQAGTESDIPNIPDVQDDFFSVDNEHSESSEEQLLPPEEEESSESDADYTTGSEGEQVYSDMAEATAEPEGNQEPQSSEEDEGTYHNEGSDDENEELPVDDNSDEVDDPFIGLTESQTMIERMPTLWENIPKTESNEFNAEMTGQLLINNSDKIGIVKTKAKIDGDRL